MKSSREEYGKDIVRDLDNDVPDQDAVVVIGRYEKLEEIGFGFRMRFVCRDGANE